MLALLTIVIGGGITLGLGQLWIHNWSIGGERFTIGEYHTVPVGDDWSLVYYESGVSVPDANVDLRFNESEEQYVFQEPIFDAENEFRVMLTGWSGRALYKIRTDRPGEYEFICINDNQPFDEVARTEDRVVFHKVPASLTEAIATRKLIYIVGGTITIILFIGFYVAHGMALKRRE